MLPALAGLALLLQAAPPPAPVDVQMPVPGSALYASFEAPGWKPDARLETRLVEQFGSAALGAGAFDGATLTLRFQPNEPERSSPQWRDLLTNGAPFEVGDVACSQSEQRLPGDGRAMVRFDAYPVAAGRVFELHVNSPRRGEVEACSRAEFEALVRSWRVQLARLARPRELPLAARDWMAKALKQPKDGWMELARELEAEPLEPAPAAALAFAFAEVARFVERPPDELLAAHERAAAAFAKLQEPSKADQLAWALSEEGSGAAELQRGQFERAREHFLRARDRVTALAHSSAPSVNYSLAGTSARLGRVDEALDALELALRVDPRFRERAAASPDFASLAAHPRFAELVRPR